MARTPERSSIVKPCITDTHSIWTPNYYRQFVLTLWKVSPYIFSKFNPLNTDTSLIWTPSMVSSVSTLIGFDSTDLCSSVVFLTI